MWERTASLPYPGDLQPISPISAGHTITHSVRLFACARQLSITLSAPCSERPKVSCPPEVVLSATGGEHQEYPHTIIAEQFEAKMVFDKSPPTRSIHRSDGKPLAAPIAVRISRAHTNAAY